MAKQPGAGFESHLTAAEASSRANEAGASDTAEGGSMYVLAVFRWEGDPDALLAAYDRELQHAVPREQPRRIAHICAQGENQVVIVDLWETEEDLRSMQENPEFLRNLEAAGFPSDRIEQIYQLHATIP
jgi:hypothetical protein